MTRKTATGCRPAQLFGHWAIEPDEFGRLVNAARGIDLKSLPRAGGAPSAPMPTLNPDLPSQYQVEDGIALITLAGPMTKYPTSFQEVLGGTSTLLTRQAIRQAQSDDEVSAIMLIIDSPGGTVDGTPDLAGDVAASKKPVYAYVDDKCCSAAYWVAAQCESISANSNAVVGSIGVFTQLTDSSKQAEQAGETVHVIASSPLKGTGVAGAPISLDQLTDAQRVINELASLFTQAVAAGRGMTPQQALAISDGRVHVGANGMTLGLVDRICTLQDAITAVSTEVQSMDVSNFDSFAAAHPELILKAASSQIAEARESARTAEALRVKQIAAAFPDNPKFALEQILAGSNMDQARLAEAELIRAENKRLKAAAAGDDFPPVDGVKATNGVTQADVKGRWKSLVQKHIAAGKDKAAAVRLAAKEDPELHAAYIASANAA